MQQSSEVHTSKSSSFAGRVKASHSIELTVIVELICFLCNMKDHSKDSGLLNRPIQDYDELSFIFGDEYDPSAAEIQLERDQNTHSDDSKISEDPMEQKIANEDIRYLVLKIGELIDAVKSLKPRDFAED